MERVAELRKLITRRISDRGLKVLEETRPRLFVCIGIMIERKMSDDEVKKLLDEALHRVLHGSTVKADKPSKVYPVIKGLFELLNEGR